MSDGWAQDDAGLGAALAERRDGLGPRALGVLAVLAAVPRLLNLGSFSMWLDEILQTRMASGSLAELLAALAADKVHPPLDGLSTWLQLHASMPETVRRLVPILFGILTIVVLSRWVSERFGRTAGWATGTIAALSPIHVQYSQELRPYSMALFFMSLALWRFDRARSARGLRQALPWMLAALAALYSLYFAALVLVPLAVLALAPDPARDGEALARWEAGRLSRFATRAGLVLVAFLPWLIAVSATPSRPIEKEAASWTVALFVRKLHHLTIGGLEGDPPTLLVILPLALIVVGVAAARDRIASTALLSGALGGTVGIELLLLGAGHWTSDRYNLVAWPFVTALVGIGIAGTARLPGMRRFRVAVATLLVTSYCLAQIGFVERYYRRGRHDWRWTARTVAALSDDSTRVYATNGWTQICSSFYLEPLGITVHGPLDAMPAPVEQVRSSPTAGCRYVIDGGYPSRRSLVRAIAPAEKILTDPGGLAGSRLYRVDAFDPARSCVWVVPPALTSRPASAWAPWARRRFAPVSFRASEASRETSAGPERPPSYAPPRSIASPRPAAGARS